ncbi:sulfite exporter TauE/SafE family protein [Aestuariibacter sp. GS-14]|uniref:sulfite exporter TauE/SafE family protein n=1 Tax=Aestuariibacter sp. GS-14 TaxID=2590670 RepID=UPI00112E4354|nr:sulfite exporter TauE/SafE family protein [Aestuariibacter sp. GS-14]TPV59942.1 sulfite exporter TauE/SafE family protein [Aestuariibacter sp. GS-14]
MTDFSLFSAFLVGIAGSVHCFGMCGGFAGALTAAIPQGKSPTPFVLSYNTGRILSYTLAGAITGALGSIAQSSMTSLLYGFKLFSAFMLIAMALYLAQWWRGLARIESLGKQLWQHLQPLSRRFLPFKCPLSALPYGIIWGWLPCGLVYSTLTWSLSAGTALQGAMIMAAFGVGTLPALLAVSFGANGLLTLLRMPKTRTFIAVTLIIYAVFLIYRTVNSIS